MCFFLGLVVFGLATVLLKIWQRRSAYGLVRLNVLAAYAVLLLLAAGNWEVWMAEYNLQPRFRTVDVGFLLGMPGRVLPTLLARRTLLGHGPVLTGENPYGGAVVLAPSDAQAQLDAAVGRWLRGYEAHPDWQGRTYADWQTHAALRNWRPRQP